MYRKVKQVKILIISKIVILGETYSNVPVAGGSSRIPTASAIPGYINGASRVLPPGIELIFINLYQGFGAGSQL